LCLGAMHGQKRNRLGDGGRTGVVEGWKFHERFQLRHYGVNRGAPTVQPRRNGGNLMISVALAPSAGQWTVYAMSKASSSASFGAIAKASTRRLRSVEETNDQANAAQWQ